MEKFNASSISETEICLERSEDVPLLYNAVMDEEDFILTWEESGKKKSKLFIGNNLIPKIKNGDVILTSEVVK